MSIHKIINRHFGDHTQIPVELLPFIKDITQYVTTQEAELRQQMKQEEGKKDQNPTRPEVQPTLTFNPINSQATTTHGSEHETESLLEISEIEQKINQLEADENRLGKQDELYKAIISNLHKGLLIFDQNYQITFINNSLKALTGFDESKIIREKILNPILYPAQRNQLDSKQLSTAFKRKEPYEATVSRKDGGSFWALITAAPLMNTTQEFIGGYVTILDISKRKQIEQNLIKASLRLSTTIQNFQSATLLEDENRNIVITNQAFCDLFQTHTTPEQLVGINTANSMEERNNLIADPVHFSRRLQQVIDDKQLVIGEEIQFANGRFYERDYIPIFSGEEYLGHLWQYKDITEKKKADITLKLSENRFRVLATNAPFGIFQTDKDGLCTFVNEKWSIITGIPAEEAMGPDWINHIHPEDKNSVFDEWTQAILENKEFKAEYKLLDDEDHVTWIFASAVAVKDDHGFIQSYIGNIVDITEKKAAEQLLKESEERYRKIFESASDIIYRADLHGRFSYINPVTLRIMNCEAKDLIGKNFTELIREDYREKATHFYMEQFQSLTPVSYFEFPSMSTKGQEIWIGQNVQLILEDGIVKEFVAVARDITDRVKADRLLKRSEEKYKSIIENMELGLVEMDTTGKITYAYDQFCKITRYSREELIGRYAEELVPDTFKRNFHEQIQKQTQGQAGAYEMQITRKNDKVSWILVSAAPLYNDQDEINGSIGICLDITPQKKTEQKLTEAMKKAEELLKAKEYFLANMSHEIRTPMNAIVGMSDLLKKTDLTAKQQKYLHAISLSANNLLVIINDILDLSKVESGKITFERIGFRITECIESILSSLAFKAEEKRILLLSQIQEGSDAIVLGDPTRLSQILINLVNNAIKFTEKGKVEVLCEVKEANEQELTFEFIVRDTGIGIPEDKLAIIFESFNQADSSITRKYGGTGLGLSICKKLIEAQQGEINVKSKPDIGSEFTFSLSFGKGTASDLPAKAEVESGAYHLDDIHILLAEDNKLNQLLVLSLAEEWGCKVDTAENGEVALQKLKSKTYDLILMDMQMPVMDGIKATSIIRTLLDPPVSQIPIIALTANSFSSDTRKCLEAGMNDFISKPFEPAQLYGKIVKLVRPEANHGSIMEIPQTNEPETTAQQHTLLNKEAPLFEMADGDKDFLTQLLEVFEQEVLAVLANMDDCLQAHDIPGIQSLAHKIKPSVDSVSYAEMKELIREIEMESVEENSMVLIERFRTLMQQLLEECEVEIENLKASSE